MGKNSFVFHGDWLDFIEKFPTETQFEIYRAIAHYGLHREMPELSPTAKVLLTVISTKIDEDNARYNSKCDQNRKNAKGDGTKSKERRKAKEEQTEMNSSTATVATTVTDAADATAVDDSTKPFNPSYDSDNDNDYDYEKKKEKEKKNGRFKPPSIAEVAAYISEKGYHIDASDWWNFYNSKGWMVGKNKMTKWKSAVATWENKWKREHENDRRFSTGAERQYQAGEKAFNRVMSRINARQSGKAAINSDNLFSQPTDGDLQG